MVPASSVMIVLAMGEEPVAPAFHVPSLAWCQSGRGCELKPGDEVRGRDRNVGLGLVRVEIEQRQLA